MLTYRVAHGFESAQFCFFQNTELYFHGITFIQHFLLDKTNALRDEMNFRRPVLDVTPWRKSCLR